MITLLHAHCHIDSLKEQLEQNYARSLILGAKHEATQNFYEFSVTVGDETIGLGLATARTAVEPSLCLNSTKDRVFVGYDMYVAEVMLESLKHSDRMLDGVFLGFEEVRLHGLLVVHELGAMMLDHRFDWKWSVCTDVVSHWAIEQGLGRLTLVELESHRTIHVEIDTGVMSA